jgi:hypothetical protein
MTAGAYDALAQELEYVIDESFTTGEFYTSGGIADLLLHDDGKVLVSGGFSPIAEATSTTIVGYFGNILYNGLTSTGLGHPKNFHYRQMYLQCGISIIGVNNIPNGTDQSFKFEFQKSAYNGFLGNDVLDAIVEPDDNILAAGRFFTDSLDISPETIRQLCRIDSTGAPDLNFPMLHCAEPVDAYVHEMDTLSDGSFILSGHFFEFGGFDYNQVGKLNPDFSVDTTFINSFEPGGELMIIHVDSQDRIWANAFSSTLIGETPIPFSINLIRLLANGEVDVNFNPPDLYHLLGSISPLGWVNDIVEMPDGTFILAGGFTSINGQERQCIAMIEDDGTVVDGVIGNIGPDEAVWGSVERTPVITNIRLLDDGKLLLGGSFSSFGGEDYHCLIRLQPQPVTTTDQIKKQGLVIYPNPATGHFTLRLPDGEGLVRNVEIFDLHGRVLRQWTAPSEFGGFYSVEGLSAGVYVVKVDTGENRFSQKLIVRPW